MYKKIIIILSCLFIFLSEIPFYVHAQDSDLSDFQKLEREKSLRTKILQVNRVIQTMNIKPGMSILDIGAGRGLFTFPLAKALKGTGKIFATDTGLDMVRYIRKKVQEDGRENIFPVLVRPEGLDPFYKQHSFDIIFLSETYHHLWHAEDYFRELRPSLKKTGRLYILELNNNFNFNEALFDDFKKVIKILISKGESFPVFTRLRQEVRQFINDWRDDEKVPPGIRTAIVGDFNKMLYDRSLFNDLYDYYHTVEKVRKKNILNNIQSVHYFKLIEWLVSFLDKDEVFDPEQKTLTDIDKKRLHRLNRIILSGIFDIHFLNELSPFIVLEKDSIISTLEAAGYSLVREYDFLTFYYFLEFKRKL